MASKRITHVKSPLVLVCSKDVEKLFSGSSTSWVRAHCANGISAHRSLRDEIVVINISLAKVYYSLQTAPISHSRFQERRKGREQVSKHQKYRLISPRSLLAKSHVKLFNNQLLRSQNSTDLFNSHTGLASSLILQIASNPSFPRLR